MTRHPFFLALTTVLVASCLLGCQTPSMLFGKRDLSDRETVAELNADADDEPSTEIADLVDRADREFQAQRYDQARDVYERVLSSDPANSHAHHHLAVIADLQEQYDAAEEHYQAALVRDGRNSQILSSMAYSYILQGRFDDAETRLNQARVADPSDRNAASNLALLYACRGDREKCQAIARTLGSADESETIVDDMFQRASELAPAKSDPDIKLAGAFDIFKKDRRQDPEAVYADGVNQETYELKQQMEAARQAAIRERRQRMSQSDPRRVIPSTAEVLGARGVANHDINDALAEIDRPQTSPRSIHNDPRVQSVSPNANTPAWANQPAPTTPAPNGPLPQSADADRYGVVNADLTQPQFQGNQPADRGIVTTQGSDYPNSPPQWPSELDRSRMPAAPQQAPRQPVYGNQGNGMNQQPPAFGQSPAGLPPATAFGPTGQQPQASSNQSTARQRAASLGMGTGLGGMFDRYAYKANPDALTNQRPLAPSTNTFAPAQTPSVDPRDQTASQAPTRNAQFDSRAYGTTPQQWPGTNSRLGAMYPNVQRQLPTDRPAAPPTITAGMPAAPNWQGQTMPSSGAYLTGPADYGTTLPSGSAAPTPPASSFGPPVANIQTLPTASDVRNDLNSGFNGLQRQMMGSPNLVPTNAYGQQQSAAARRAATSGRPLPTQTGPTNPNVPYYNQNTGPTSGGLQNSGRVGLPQSGQLPSGFVEPPPYRGGAYRQNLQTGTNQPRPTAQTPDFPQQRGGSLPQITPGGQL